MIEPTNRWKTMLGMFIAERTPKCHDVTRLISQAMERPLPWRVRLAIWIHFRICLWCERYRDQLAFIGKALRSCPEHGAERTGLSSAARARFIASGGIEVSKIGIIPGAG